MWQVPVRPEQGAFALENAGGRLLRAVLWRWQQIPALGGTPHAMPGFLQAAAGQHADQRRRKKNLNDRRPAPDFHEESGGKDEFGAHEFILDAVRCPAPSCRFPARKPQTVRERLSSPVLALATMPWK